MKRINPNGKQYKEIEKKNESSLEVRVEEKIEEEEEA